MSGWAIVVLVLGVFAFGTAGYCFELWLNKKQREEQKKNDEEFLELMSEYDGNGYGPTIYFNENGLCTTENEDPAARDADAKHFKDRLVKIYYRRG